MRTRIALTALTLTLVLFLSGCGGGARSQAPVFKVIEVDSPTRISIENQAIRVTVEAPDNHFEIYSKLAGKTIIAHGTVPITGGSITMRGTTPIIRIAAPDGSSAELSVDGDLPFLLCRLTLVNSGTEPKIFNRVPVASFDADWADASSLVTMGTGGLSSADKNPGSYVWVAVADPESRNGIVAGWVTNDRASGVFFPKVVDGKVVVDARADYGHLRLMPGQTTETETLAIGCFDDARKGLEAYADAVAANYQIKLPPQPTGYCTWYAEKHGRAADLASLGILADFAEKNLKPFGFSFVQIDDGWQMGEKLNGSRKNFTQVDPKGPYPTGLKAAADLLKAHGLTPGIWFLPFSGTYNDPWFADKQDLFVRTTGGKPYDTAWGGTCLDMSNPKARDYLRSIVRQLHDWGFTYFKMDGLWTGLAAKQIYVDSGYKEDNFGDAVFHDPDFTNVQAYRTGLKLVRDTVGPNAFLLGCNVAQNMRMYGASFGLFDAMRIGPDNKGSWAGWMRSPTFGSRNYFLNGRIWYNDPDPEYQRASLSDTEARTIASWIAISGQLNTNSDWEPDLPPDRLENLRRTMPAHGKTARPVDYFENDLPRIWQVTDDKFETRRDVIALFNWTDDKMNFDVPLSRFDLPKADRYAAYDFWGRGSLVLVDNINATVPAHGCMVLAIRPMLDHPFVISTSRHITQGMIDLSGEKWDAATATLSGKSQVVGGDQYEIAFAGGEISGFTISADDQAAGVRGTEDDSGTRAAIDSPVSRIVSWSATYRK